jgi:hypothetical protein|nr:MAG TPA: hypothetical protein [Caudoviricetes sp.]
MNAVEYIKTLHRLCKSQDGCFECVLDSEDGCIAAASRYDKNAVPIVEQWAKDHPVKTRQREFLKMFPDAETDRSGILIFCPRKFDPVNINSVHCHRHGCLECRKDYWLTEVTDNGNVY